VFAKSTLKQNFFTGLAIALPLLITFGIVIYLINLLTDPFVQVLSRFLLYFFKELDLSVFFLTHRQVLVLISKFLAILVLFSIITFLGVLGQTFLNQILVFFDALFRRIPIVNKIYNAIQQVVSSFFSHSKKIDRQVVMVPFPDPHNSCLGIMIGNALKVCEEATRTDLVSVLIPTCPIPLTGFIVMVKPQDLILIDMSIEDAIKYILSCGILSSPLPIVPTENMIKDKTKKVPNDS
jgi:uncharacterized membrane protein